MKVSSSEARTEEVFYPPVLERELVADLQRNVVHSAERCDDAHCSELVFLNSFFVETGDDSSVVRDIAKNRIATCAVSFLRISNVARRQPVRRHFLHRNVGDNSRQWKPQNRDNVVVIVRSTARAHSQS